MVEFNIDKVRNDFPILKQEVNGYPLVYLDNAATTQKPQMVIDAIKNYYEHYNSNVHRGVHQLSMQATMAYEDARAKVARFIHANKPQECIFVRGTTEGVNLVAQSYFLPRLQEGDEIILSHMEHHSNIVPWQMICERVGALIKVAPISFDGELLIEEFEKLLSPKTK